MSRRRSVWGAVAFGLCVAFIVGIVALLIATPRPSRPLTVEEPAEQPTDTATHVQAEKKSARKDASRKSTEQKKKKRPKERSFLDEPVQQE